MGDFNINLLNMNSHKETERFLNTMLDNLLIPHITQPSRFDQNLNSSLIDNIFFNDISSETISGNLVSHVTDHLPNFLLIPVTIQTNMKTKPSTKKRDFTNFDLHEFRNDILSMNLLHKLSSINDPNKKYDLFHDNLSL